MPPVPDVLVIGAGVIGLSTAFRLASEGLRVTLVERSVFGREASWAGAGIIQSGGWHRSDSLVQLQRESVRRYASWTADLRERTGVDPQFVVCGSFELLLEDQQYRMAASEVRAAEVFREQYGSSVLELLSPEQARAQEPAITRELLGVQSSPFTGQVRNPLLLEALQLACTSAGVTLIEDCAVTGLIRTGQRVTGAHTTRGDFSSGHVVLAAGSWSSSIDPELQEAVPVYPVRGQMILLEMRPRPFAHVIERGRCYLVPRLDGRILVGATEEHDAGYDKRNTAGGIAGLLELARRLVPRLDQATLLRTWAGLRPGTPDGGPYLGPVPGSEGLLAACGHFRSGLTLAPITADIIADLIVRGRTPWDLSRFAPGRELKTRREPPRT